MILDALRESVASMDAERVRHLAERALEEEVEPEALLRDALMPGIEAFREAHDRGQRCIQELWLVQSINELMRVLDPHLAHAPRERGKRVVIGTVEGDAHGLGKNLVKQVLGSSGFEVCDLGTDVPAAEFVSGARRHDAVVVGASAMLDTTRGRMREVTETLDASGIRDRVRIMIGGAPVSQDYADEIGADGYAPDATSSVGLARRLVADVQAAHRPMN